jgi:predicted DNA-binding protein with PD1-like motif
MTYALIGETYVVRLDTGEEIFGSVAAFAADRRIDAASVSGIGAAYDVVLGYFDRVTKSYTRRTVAEECEIVSLAGNISVKEGAAFPHLHVALGLPDFTMLGGHLFEGRAGATCEIVVRPFGGYAQRRHDPTTGLYLLDL